MSYFDQISPATSHRVVVDLTEFSRPYQQWRAGVDAQVADRESQVDKLLASLQEQIGEDAYNDLVMSAAKEAIAEGKTYLDFTAYLPSEFTELREVGGRLSDARSQEYTGQRWTLQWGQIDTVAGAKALKNLEHVQRRHPDWGMDQVSGVALMAAHHQAQAGEPLPGELYDTLASKSEFAHVWTYLSARLREEYPEIFASDAATLKNVFCGRARALAAAGTPPK
jgi:hypothetical protein